MLRFVPVLFPLMIPACTSKDATGDDSSAVTDTDADTDTDTDTDADGDTDTDADGDTDTDTDTDTTPEGDITFNLDGEWSGQMVTLTWFDIRSVTAETLAFGETLGTWAASADPLTVTPDAPAESEFIELDAKAAPGLMTAFYVPALFTDTDGDGLRAGSEPWTGVGSTYVVYVEGTIPAEYSASGVVAGWNDFTFTESGISSSPATAVPLATNLTPVDTLTFGGTWGASDLKTARYGLALLPGSVFTGGAVESYVVDQVMTDPFTATVTGDPPLDHQQELDIPGSTGALEVPVAYFDITDDNVYASGDILAHGVCFDGSQVIVSWLAPPTSLGTAYTYAATGRVVGWGIYSAGTGEALTGIEAAGLEITDSCPLG